MPYLMRYRGAQICRRVHGSCCLYRRYLHRSLSGGVTPIRTYSAQPQPGSVPPVPPPAPPDGKGGGEVLKERALSAFQHAGDLGRQWGQRSAQAAGAAVNYWWQRYEEFVGLNEVRVAQTNVTEAEAAFMVARGIVREAHGSLESLQGRLKEVRDRLDRVSREEAHYLELATLEHKLLQEERRLRTAYENAESSERERFALFSAAVRESHEKERTRAERTKNWSIIGSVLGALIGVMGSTYVNRVRLQELKNLLLEAQKGPESLQEALRVQAGNHRGQQDELRTLIDSLRVTVNDVFAHKGGALQDTGAAASPTLPLSAFKDLNISGRKADSLLESLPPQLGNLEQGLGRVEGTLLAIRRLVESRPESRPERLETGVQTGSESRPERLGTGVQTGSESRPERLGTGVQMASESTLRHLEETRRTLGEQIRTSTFYHAVFTYTATAITVTAIYLLLRGTS